MSISGEVTEKGKSKDFVTQGRTQRADSLRTGNYIKICMLWLPIIETQAVSVGWSV